MCIRDSPRGGPGRNTILIFDSKCSRDLFVEYTKKQGWYTSEGHQLLARVQIPDWRREQDQPFKCAVKCWSDIFARSQRCYPTWGIQALWFDVDGDGGAWQMKVRQDRNNPLLVL
eukprot:5651184-Alexandrium_andersonii.AAC.1